MAMSLLQLAKKILEEEKRALSAWEIWQVAENKGYDKLVDASGITPADALLSAWIHADVRDNPRSVFVSLRDQPHRYILRSHMDDIRQGKKVRILENVNYILDDFTHITEVIATKGSTGTILSYGEYNAHIKDMEKRDGVFVPQHHRAWVNSGMEAGARYPVRFDEVVPLSEDDYAKLKQEYDIVEVSCRVGAVLVVPTNSFVVI